MSIESAVMVGFFAGFMTASVLGMFALAKWELWRRRQKPREGGSDGR